MVERESNRTVLLLLLLLYKITEMDSFKWVISGSLKSVPELSFVDDFVLLTLLPNIFWTLLDLIWEN